MAVSAELLLMAAATGAFLALVGWLAARLIQAEQRQQARRAAIAEHGDRCTVTVVSLRTTGRYTNARQEVSFLLAVESADQPRTLVASTAGISIMDAPRLVVGATFPAKINPGDLGLVLAYPHLSDNATATLLSVAQPFVFKTRSVSRPH